jgi:hypothetical protein
MFSAWWTVITGMEPDVIGVDELLVVWKGFSRVKSMGVCRWLISLDDNRLAYLVRYPDC